MFSSFKIKNNRYDDMYAPQDSERGRWRWRSFPCIRCLWIFGSWASTLCHELADNSVEMKAIIKPCMRRYVRGVSHTWGIVHISKPNLFSSSACSIQIRANKTPTSKKGPPKKTGVLKSTHGAQGRVQTTHRSLQGLQSLKLSGALYPGISRPRKSQPMSQYTQLG